MSGGHAWAATSVPPERPYRPPLSGSLPEFPRPRLGTNRGALVSSGFPCSAEPRWVPRSSGKVGGQPSHAPNVEDNTGAAKEELSCGVHRLLLEERKKTETDRTLSGLPFQFIN